MWRCPAGGPERPGRPLRSRSLEPEPRRMHARRWSGAEVVEQARRGRGGLAAASGARRSHHVEEGLAALAAAKAMPTGTSIPRRPASSPGRRKGQAPGCSEGRRAASLRRTGHETSCDRWYRLLSLRPSVRPARQNGGSSARALRAAMEEVGPMSSITGPGFVERTNVTGSKAFARMILEGRFDDALSAPASRSRTARRSSTSTWTRPCSTPGGDGALPEPDRRRARHRARAGHDRQLEVGR